MQGLENLPKKARLDKPVNMCRRVSFCPSVRTRLRMPTIHARTRWKRTGGEGGRCQEVPGFAPDIVQYTVVFFFLLSLVAL